MDKILKIDLPPRYWARDGEMWSATKAKIGKTAETMLGFWNKKNPSIVQFKIILALDFYELLNLL